jgi:excinuclease ABC subunit B
VVIVASVSCIYGIGSPEAYYGMLLLLEKGQQISRKELLGRLVELLYERNDHEFSRGKFRVRGDVVEVFPSYDESAYRIELWGDEIDGLFQIDPLHRPDPGGAVAASRLSEDALCDERRYERAGDGDD